MQSSVPSVQIINAPSKFRYSIVIVDEYSRTAWRYGLKTKDEAAQAFQVFIKTVVMPMGYRIYKLKCDPRWIFRHFQRILQEQCNRNTSVASSSPSAQWNCWKSKWRACGNGKIDDDLGTKTNKMVVLVFRYSHIPVKQIAHLSEWRKHVTSWKTHWFEIWLQPRESLGKPSMQSFGY